MDDFYTVEQISEMLKIHPKTIQRYIREGKLNAAKIGKSWRITGHDLSLFTENNKSENHSKHEYVKYIIKASSVIDISLIGKENAIRIMNSLTAVNNSKPYEYGQSSLQFQYIEREDMIRITLWGDLRFMTIMLDTITMLTESHKG